MAHLTPSPILFPTIRCGVPDAGWLKLWFTGPETTLEFVISCTPEDSLVTLLIWLEMLLLGELPARWYVNGEELCMYVYAAELPEGVAEVTIYKPIDHFAAISEDPEQIWWRGQVAIRRIVAAWTENLQQALATNFGARTEWPLDVAKLDFSRITALLAGATPDPVWLAAYHPPDKRVQQLSQQL